MMHEFDRLKAVREELTGLVDVLATIKRRENAAEQAMGLAEGELNAVRKLRGYCEAEIAWMREHIRKLEAAELDQK
jgi:hypothetical protein